MGTTIICICNPVLALSNPNGFTHHPSCATEVAKRNGVAETAAIQAGEVPNTLRGTVTARFNPEDWEPGSLMLMEPESIDMVLYCPACGVQHVDAPEGEWDNPPHRSHLCPACGNVWRPADVPTNGVTTIKTKGKADADMAELGRLIAKEAPAIAWIIERSGRPPIMCHCPDVAAEMALRPEYVVTPYVSKVKP